MTRHRTGPNPDWDLVDGSAGHLLDPFDDMTGVVPIETGLYAATFADGSPGWYDSRRHVRVSCKIQCIKQCVPVGVLTDIRVRGLENQAIAGELRGEVIAGCTIGRAKLPAQLVE